MLKLYNTLSGKKEEFRPIFAKAAKGRAIKDKKVGMYNCGPTVYDFATIGNFRTYIFEDILRRVLEYNSYKVKEVMNITDVGHLTSDADVGEDKMLQALKREGKKITKEAMLELAQYYTKVFKKNMKRLNILEPHIWAKASEHIEEQIELVKKLEERGYTYQTGVGVIFDTSKLDDYGKLANIDPKELKVGARTEEDPERKNPTDFALWITNQPKHIMQWDSPWGRGFPGWHLECSAMSMKYLGDHFDIHTGGVDHIPVHHTNEIAQSEAATGKKFVNYWLHGEFLLVDGGKMSKSLGNFYTLKDIAEKGFDPLAFRFFTLSAHYRSKLNFTWQAMESAQEGFDKLKGEVRHILREKSRKQKIKNTKNQKYKEKFLEAINDDLNMPKAVALLWGAVKSKELSNKDKYKLVLDFDKVFGLGLAEIKLPKIPKEIEKTVKEREKARKNENWAKADELRDELAGRGWEVEDTSEGPVVKKI